MPIGADEFSGKRFGKYEVLCRLAVGGMAEIFLGFPLTGPFAFRPVVLKRILSDHREDPSSLQMLIDEAKLTAQLSHRHIAQVLDLEVDGEDVILVIELIQGANLEELVEKVGDKKEQLPLGFVIAVIRDAAQGLQHAHAHKDPKTHEQMPIIHRDVTPRNVMVAFDGLGKMLDFGIARAVGASRRTVAGMVRGTAAYMSPEQAIDAKVDTRSDIFSLGTIFHELLTGQRLFARGNPGKEMAAVYEGEIPTPSVANKRVPKSLDAIVLKALERSVSRRYQTPAELIRDLGSAQGAAAWPIERSGTFVKELFADRQKQLQALLDQIPDEGPQVSTDVGRERLSDEQLESEMRTVVGVRPADVAPAPATIQMPAPQVPASMLASSKAKPAGAPQPRRTTSKPPSPREADAAAATKFFTPEFGPKGPVPVSDVERGTDEGPIPTLPGAIPPTMSTQPGVPAPNGILDETPMSNPSASSPSITQRRTLSSDTATHPGSQPRSGARTAVLLFGALGAMVLGAAGGVLVYRSMAPQKQMPGVGRVSVSTDWPAEVKMGDTVLKAPFTDVYMATGPQEIEVREVDSGGPWKRVPIDVKPDVVNRFDIKLDTPPPPP